MCSVMRDRNLVDHCIRVVSALALLAAVMTSSSRPLKHASGCAAADCLSRTFASALKYAARVTAAPIPSRPSWVKALRTEFEEEDLIETISSESEFFDLLSHQCPNPSGHFITTGTVRSLHPLRC